MPSEAAPYLVRVATLHPRVLEDFLWRFFLQVSDAALPKSTFLRATLIASSVRELGWSAEKHTKRLIELNAIKPSENASELEMVKKFIRDLRSRYRKHRELMSTYEERRAARKGTFRVKN